MPDDEQLSIYDEVEIEDMTYDETLQIYHYPCPCGDRFEIALYDLMDGEDIGVCPSCSLMIRVIFEAVSLDRADLRNWCLDMEEGLLTLGCRKICRNRRGRRRRASRLLLLLERRVDGSLAHGMVEYKTWLSAYCTTDGGSGRTKGRGHCIAFSSASTSLPAHRQTPPSLQHHPPDRVRRPFNL